MPPPPIERNITPSASRSLVPVGPGNVSTRRNRSTRDEHGQKPTTARALILRNGKYGARGTGEMMLASKLSGWEKLDLLAEDLVKRSNTAVMSPFRLEKCLNIAESQCNAFLDEIANLKDPELFSPLILTELNARVKAGEARNRSVRDPSYVASIVATKIHNTYLLASAWKLISETLARLAIDGLTDGTIKLQLSTNSDHRARYLVLHRLATLMVEINQRKVSVLATTTPHYARYFKPDPDSTNSADTDMIFDWAELRDACTSFLDSIVVELCFPHAPYPEVVLCQILRDALDESPKETKRFPQELWNAIGDLSVSLEFRQLLEAPLAGPDAQSWKEAPHDMPRDYEYWVGAQELSERASNEYSSYQDIIFPLTKTRSPGALDIMWERINLHKRKTYRDFTGEDIDTLWRLSDALSPIPQWHAPANSGNRRKISPSTSKWQRTSDKRLTITNDPASDDSMPDLQSVSDSSYEHDFENDSDVQYDSGSETGESGYDTEQEEEHREMLREAMDTAHEIDWAQSQAPEGDKDLIEQGARKGNPFLKLLGSLRGRVFSSNPKIRATSRVMSSKPLNERLRCHDLPPVMEGAEESTGSHPQQAKADEATVDIADAEDEGAGVSQAKKKPKKYRKKKKPKALIPRHEGNIANGNNVKSPVASTSSVLPDKKISEAVPAVSNGSTLSLPLPTESMAQSARSYIREKLDAQKPKVKSRPSHPTFFRKLPETFAKLLSRAKGNKEEEPRDSLELRCFPKLGKKSRALMHQLLNTEGDMKGAAPMKWDKFVKLMREMGFNYEPGTAGSSVRFDPPDKRDTPISFHRPHPDPTLTPVMLKDFSKRLQKYYGWSKEKFLSEIES